MKPPALPPREQIAPTTPLRLSVAAALAYPDGSMTVSGLRKEAKRGRLVIERTAGKDYTTLVDIERMRGLCRKPLRDHASGCAANGAIDQGTSLTPPFGSSVTMGDIQKARDAALTIVAGLSNSSLSTSQPSTSPRQPKASVTPIKSPSQT